MTDGATATAAQARSTAVSSAVSTAVSLADVTISFRLADGGSYTAVEHASLDVADGEFVSIVGPTGCGKSTLLNATAGLFPPSQGRVRDFRRGAVRPQSPGRLPVSVRGAVPLEDRDRERRHRPRDHAARRTMRRRRAPQEWLGRVGLGSLRGALSAHAVRRAAKRVGLAQVLIRDPKILLMDEPFGPLDAQTRQIMGNLLLQLWSADRKAVMFVTHDLEEAIALSDRVVIMSAGPAAHIIGDWKVPLARPRDISEIKLDPAFHKLHREIWDKLKDEVMKGYAQTGWRLNPLRPLCTADTIHAKPKNDCQTSKRNVMFALSRIRKFCVGCGDRYGPSR